MRSLLLPVLAAAAAFAAGPPAASAATVSIGPSADAGLPFWCQWGYDPEERCFVDDGPRLPVGGAEDKVWRAALRFPLHRLPARAAIVSARLLVRHDGTCIAPRLSSVPCGELGYVLDVHRILGDDWLAEREVEIDPAVVGAAVLLAGWSPQWLSWDVTGLVRAWHARAVPNGGLLLKLQDGDEELGYGGPYFPSSSHPEPVARPRLVVSYATG